MHSAVDWTSPAWRNTSHPTSPGIALASAVLFDVSSPRSTDLLWSAFYRVVDLREKPHCLYLILKDYAGTGLGHPGPGARYNGPGPGPGARHPGPGP